MEKNTNNDIYFLITALIICLLFIIMILLIYNHINKNTETNYGKWNIISSTNCVNEGKTYENTYCDKIGTVTITEKCEKNISTGYGCINNGEVVPNGTTRTLAEECNPICRSSIWEVEETGCSTNNEDLNLCYIDSGGSKITKKTCVKHDENGTVNECTSYNDVEVLIQDGSVLNYKTLINNPIGTVIETEETCYSNTNERCGSWVVLDPETEKDKIVILDPTVPRQEEILDNIGTCGKFSGAQFSFEKRCVTNSNGNTIFDLYKEGFFNISATCQIGNGKFYTPSSEVETPVYDNCPSIEGQTLISGNEPGQCNSNIINPEDISGENISSDENRLICPNSNNNQYNNPVCLQLCRLSYVEYDNSLDILGDMNFMLNNVCMIIKDGFILCPLQYPSIDGLYIPLRSDIVNGDYDPLPMMFVNMDNFKTSRRCSLESIMFSSAMLFLFGIRESINNTHVKTQIISTFNNFVGWSNYSNVVDPSGTNRKTLTWNQVKSGYDSSGINSDEADIFNVNLTEPFKSEKIPGFPGAMLGCSNINLRSSSNNTINIVRYQYGDIMSLDNCKLVVFSRDIFKMKLNSDLLNCSIFNIT